MKDRLIRLNQSFSFIGLMLATLFFAASVTPSLLPRTFFAQGILSGFALALGYAAGVLFVWIYQVLQIREPGPHVQRIAKWVTGVVVAIVFVTFLWRMAFWQNSIRELMGIPALTTAYPIRTAAIALVVGGLVIGIGRLFGALWRLVTDKLSRFVPPRIASMGALATLVVVVMFLTNDVAGRALLSAADSFFAGIDERIDDDLQRPTDPSAPGGQDSLIPWQTIGRQGKSHLVTGPTRDDIAAWTQTAAMKPIRVYAGLRSRATMNERAALALAELKRVGGFDRAILIVATPTGTGWLDPSAVDTVEYLHGGNTAIVSMQYSYLPSWITIAVDPRGSIDAAAALFDAIYGHWKTLRKDTRPRLYLQGLSLGSLGSEVSADLFTVFEDPIDGALWSGPPFPSQNWNARVRQRNPDSPVWLPQFRDGRMLRFTGQDNALQPDRPWGPMRSVYIQYASDPMVWFSPDLAWNRPAWLDEPRGPDVSPHLSWLPLITFLQVGFDVPMATSVPLGHGHNYAPANYIDGWISVTQPDEAIVAKAESLKDLFRQKETPKP